MSDSETERTEDVKSKVRKMLEMRHETEKEALDALRILSAFGPVECSRSQRNLRNRLEKKNLETFEKFVSSFGVLNEHLDAVYADVLDLNASIDKMASRLQDSKNKTHHLITQTTALQDERRKVEKRLLLANAFISHFQLTSLETATLHGVSRDSPVSGDFFVTLRKIDRLHDDCKSLIHAGFETAALDIMEKIGLHKEAAVERLYRWTQNACRNFDPSDSESLVPEAMGTLRSRPVLFKYVTDEYCAARKANLVARFIDALTKGSKPIECHAHDPKRYVGDILAWVHQTLPVEKEGLAGLFRYGRETPRDQESRRALAQITEGLCHPLKVRLELILTADKSPLLLCAVTNLIKFYTKVLAEEIDGGLLHATLNELRQQSENVFLQAVERKVQNDLAHGVKAPPSDLTPSSVVSELLRFLRDLLALTPASEQKDRTDLNGALSVIVDPLLRAINETACHLPSTDMATYLLNCLYQIQCTVSLCQFKNDYAERLQAQSDAQMDTLTSEQASSLVANLNLGSIYTILQEHERSGPLSATPGMEPPTLRLFMNKFDGFIAMPDTFLLPQISLLMSSSNRQSIRKRSFQVITAIYNKLHSSIHDPNNKYENPQTIVRRSPQEVAELLAL